MNAIVFDFALVLVMLIILFAALVIISSIENLKEEIKETKEDLSNLKK